MRPCASISATDEDTLRKSPRHRVRARRVASGAHFSRHRRGRGKPTANLAARHPQCLPRHRAHPRRFAARGRRRLRRAREGGSEDDHQRGWQQAGCRSGEETRAALCAHAIRLRRDFHAAHRRTHEGRRSRSGDDFHPLPPRQTSRPRSGRCRLRSCRRLDSRAGGRMDEAGGHRARLSRPLSRRAGISCTVTGGNRAHRSTSRNGKDSRARERNGGD